MKYHFSGFNNTILKKVSTYKNLLFTLLFILASLHIKGADILIVSNLNDSGTGSLRNAISTASSLDTIRFNDGLFGTIFLSTGQLNINTDIVIEGPGADEIIVSGNGISRVFYIGAGVSAEIYDLTIELGYTTGDGGSGNGAGILLDGNLKIGYCNINDNIVDDGGSGGAGAGIYNNGNLSIYYCNIFDNYINSDSGNLYGVGIMNTGSASIYQCNINDNYFLGTASSFGGGICSINVSGHNLDIENSAIYNNDADIGGGVHLDENGTTYITNTTISGNWGNTYGGGINCLSYVELLHTTIANNDNMGIRAGAASTDIQLINSILDNNSVANISYSNGNIFSSHTSMSDNSYSLSGVNDQVLVSNLNLGALQENGGFTLTHALNAGSAAIDNADNAQTTLTEQRGYMRIANVVADRGAFEFGTFAIEPNQQIDDLTFLYVSTNKAGFVLEITGEEPERYLVVRRKSVDSPTLPVDGQEYTVGGLYAGQTIVYNDSEIYIDDTYNLIPGTDYVYDVYTFNGASNETNYNLNSPFSIAFQTLQAPIITSFSQTEVSPEDNITIYGSNFNSEVSENIVRVGGIEAIINSGSDTELNITVPYGAASLAEVVVTDITEGLQGSSISSLTPYLKIVFAGGDISEEHTFLENDSLDIAAAVSTLSNADLNNDGLNDILLGLNSQIAIAYRKPDNTGFENLDYIPVTHTFDKLIAKDIDNDGLLDISGIDNTSDKITVIYRASDNSDFSLQEEFQIVPSPTDMQISDINHDGYNDIIVTGSGQFTILYRNPENTEFENPVFYGPGAGVSNLTIADFNQDGKSDIAVTLEQSTDNLHIYLQNSSDNNFSLDSKYTAGDSPTSIVHADFNNDNIQDLITLNVFENTFNVLQGFADGSFSVVDVINTLDFPYAMHAGDLDGDGNTDLALLSITNEQISIFKGYGNLNFSDDIIENAGTAPEWLIIGDLNNDGKSDIAVNNTGEESIGIHYYTEPPFSITSISPSPNSNNIEYEQPIIIEFDKNIDAASVDENSITIRGSISGMKAFADYNVVDNTISIDPSSGVDFIAGEKVTLTITDLIDGANGEIFEGAGSTFFKVKTDLAPAEFIETGNINGGGSNKGFAVGDFDNDFIPDVAILKADEVKIYVGNANGTFTYNTYVSLGSSPDDIEINDFNNDGIDDILISDNVDNTITVFFNSAGTYQIPLGINIPTEIKSFDFDNDGWLDIAVALGNTNKLRLYSGQDDGTFSLWGEIESGSTFINQIDAADINNDGDIDIVVSQGNSDDIEIFTHSNGIFTSSQIFPNEASVTIISELQYIDLNNDGNVDLAYSDYNSKTLSIHLNDGNGSFGTRSIINLTSLPSSFAHNDFNGDSFEDIAIPYELEDNIAIYLGKGDGTFQIPQSFTAGNGPSEILAFPADGDLDVDILLLNTAGTSIPILLNDATPEIILNQVNITDTNLPKADTKAIYKFTANVAKENTTFESISFTTNGNYLSTDLEINGFKLLHNTIDDITTATELSNVSSITGSGETISFNSIDKELLIGSNNYLWLTVDISTTATIGNTIGINQTWFTDIAFSDGNKTGTDPIAASNIFTIQAAGKPEPSDHVTSFTAYQTGTNGINISWLDAIGSQLPDSYLLLGRKNSSVFPLVSDFNTIADDNDWTDGTVSLNLIHTGATSSQSFTGLEENETYYFLLYPYTNSGIDINYKTDNVPAASVTIVNPPAIQATNINFTIVNNNTITLNWTNGGGTSRIVVASAGNTISDTPVDFASYAADANFGDGTTIGTGNYVVYKGTGNNVTVTGLSPSSQYTFKVFEFNGLAGNEKYTTNDNTANPLSQYTLANEPNQQAENLLFSNVTPNSLSISFTAPANIPEGYIITRSTGITTPPIDGINYSIGETIGLSTVVYKGSGLTLNQNTLSPEENYFYEIYAYNGSGQSINYLQSNPLSGNITLPATEPTNQSGNILFTALNSNSLKINWINGNGSNRLVIIKESNPTDALPVDQVTYSANTSFGSGDQIGSGNFVVYKGTGNNVTVTGLSPEKNYFAQIFEFNGSAGTENYLTNTFVQNPSSRFSLPVLTNQVTISNSNPGGINSDGMLITSGTSVGDYLQDPLDEITWGHNGATATETTSLAQGTVNYRWERAWYIAKSDQKGNSDGMLNITFDLSEAGLATTLNKDFTYFLIYSPDNIQNYSIVNYKGAYKVPVDDKISFTINAANLPEGYYTLGRTDATPIAENALKFDGIDDYVQLGNQINVPSSFTLEAWVLIEDTLGKQPIISKGINDENESFLLMIEEGKIIFDWGGSSAKLNSNYRLTSGQWYHVAATFDNDNSTANIFLNGFKIAERNTTPPHTNGMYQTYIGKAGIEFFNGKIDEVRIWNKARTTAEIKADSYKHINGNENNLFAYYRFDKFSGNILPDLSQNNYSGLLESSMNNTNWVISQAMIKPLVTFNGNQIAETVKQDKRNYVFYNITLTASQADVFLSSLKLTTYGTYINTDLDNFNLYLSEDAILDTLSDNLLQSIATPTSGSIAQFNNLITRPILRKGVTYYLFVTTNVKKSATLNNTFGINAPLPTDFVINAGNVTTGTVNNGGAQTIISPYVVTNINDAGKGSLRWAIANANKFSNQTISFNIPGAGPWTINLASDLPAITKSTIIDGSTQNNWSAINRIRLNGQNATLTNGLLIQAVNTEIYGLTIYGFDNGIFIDGDGQDEFIIGAAGKGNNIKNCNTGLLIKGADNGYVYGNRIGTNPDGSSSDPNILYGIHLQDNASGINIGSNVTGTGNVVASNIEANIYLENTGNNFITGNLIGSNLLMDNKLGGKKGIWVNALSSNNTIGGILADQGNIISGHTEYGVLIEGTSNTVSNNIIGSNQTLTSNLSNDLAGIYITGSDNQAGGNTSDQSNTLLFNESAIIVDGASAINNNLRFNSIFCNNTGIQLLNNSNSQITAPTINYANATTINGTSSNSFTIDVYSDNLDTCATGQGKLYLGTAITNATGDWTFTGSFEDGHQITAQATNTSGNSSTFSIPITVDVNPPSVPVITSISDDSNISNDFITNDQQLIINGTAEIGVAVTLFINDVDAGTTNADGSGNWFLDISSNTLVEGSYNLNVKAVDASLNESALSANQTVIIDTSSPTAPIFTSISEDTGTPSDGITSDANFIIYGSTEANSAVSLFLNNGVLSSITSDTLGNFSYDLTSASLSDGIYNFTATSTDIAGNESSISNQYQVTINTSVPSTPVITTITDDTDTVGDRITQDNTLIFSGTADAGISVEVSINGSIAGNTIADGDGNWIFDNTAIALTEGNYDVTAKAVNNAGTYSANSEIFNLTYIITPSSQASNLSIANTTENSTTVNWSAGNGNGELMVIFNADDAISLPENNTYYTANSDYNVASSLGTGKIIYVGTANNTIITGLQPATKYKSVVFSYNDIGTYISYQTDTLSNVVYFETLSTEPLNPPNGLIFTEIQEDTLTFSFLPSIQNDDSYLVVRRQTDAELPIDGTSYQVNDMIGSQLVSYVGTDVSFTQTGLQPLSTYIFDIYAFKGTGENTNYLQSPTLTKEVNTPDFQPVDQAENLQLLALNSSTIQGSFNSAPSGADGYLVLYTNQDNIPLTIADGTVYFEEEIFDGWTVLQIGSSTSFTAENLNINTNYTFTVMAFNGSGNTTNYRVQDRLIASIVTGNNAPTAIQLNNLSVVESAESGTLVGILSTTDADLGDTHTYSLVNDASTTDPTAFIINGDRLELNKKLYFTDNQYYNIKVETNDNLGGIFTQEFAIEIIELPLSQSDSLSVLALFNSLNPKPVFNSDSPVKTWPGVSIRGGKVTGIDLSSRGLDSLGVTHVLALDALDTLNVYDNQLTFQYLEPFSGVISNFTYLPQASSNTIDTLIAFSNRLISISINENTINEKYQWYKSGELLQDETNTEISFISPSLLDEGTYRCEINSTVITDLTLYSKTYYLKVINVMNQQDSLSLLSVMQDLFIDQSTFDPEIPAANWPGVVEENNRVIEINLSNAGLKGEINPAIGNLTELKQIDLFNNELQGTIPKEIGNLINLTYLDLDQNNLEGDVPESIGNLVKLTTLWLARNNFTSIPESIGNLVDLQYLFLQENNLSSLPESLGLLTKLKSLDISNNDLTSFINNLSGLINLEELDLSDNQISQISGDIALLSKLRILDLSNNNLTDLTVDFSSLNTLEQLFIYNNYLTFEDIEPLDINSSNYQLYYAPQKRNGISEDVLLTTGSTYDIDLTLGGSDNYYVWLKDGVSFDTTTSGIFNIPALSLQDAGTYSAKVYSNLVTDLEVFQKDLNIYVSCESFPFIEIATIYDTTVCSGKNIYIELTADVAEGATYTWRKDGQKLVLANSEKYVAFETGLYNLIVTDTNGCAAMSNEISISTVATPTVEVFMPDSTTMVAQSDFNNGLYKWYLDGQLIEGSNDSTLSVSESGLYKASVENNFGCEGYSEEVSFVVTGLENNLISQEISIYPNPVSDKIFIDIPYTNTLTKIEIFNVIGEKILMTDLQIQEIDLSELPRGVYTLILHTQKGTAAKRFVKI